MAASPDSPVHVNQRIAQLFALVTEALAGATDALLRTDVLHAEAIIAADRSVDELTEELVQIVWGEIARSAGDLPELRRLVSVLLILPELERSADLAEHIAQRAVTRLGSEMTAVSRGIVQRMSDVAVDMWQATGDAYASRALAGVALDAADEELDLLRDRLVAEVAAGAMTSMVSGQVTLLGRFYERLGDHAVNLARRIESFADPGGPRTAD
ncbi:MAG TPA: PhoU domain-containing protein [Acidimicrobiales bacterium]|nr:PhoU domain-containing protein [Acidimicrobiales bacterium]